MITARALSLLAFLVATSSCGGWRSVSPASAGAPASINEAVQSPIVAAGTSFQAHLEPPILVEHTHVGDRLTARLDDPLIAADDRVVAPTGSTLTGRVVEVGRGRIIVQFDRLHVNGNAYPLVTAATDVFPLPTGTGGGPPAVDAPPPVLSFVVARPLTLPPTTTGQEIQTTGEVDRTFW